MRAWPHRDIGKGWAPWQWRGKHATNQCRGRHCQRGGCQVAAVDQADILAPPSIITCTLSGGGSGRDFPGFLFHSLQPKPKPSIINIPRINAHVWWRGTAEEASSVVLFRAKYCAHHLLLVHWWQTHTASLRMLGHLCMGLSPARHFSCKISVLQRRSTAWANDKKTSDGALPLVSCPGHRPQQLVSSESEQATSEVVTSSQPV